ncbi:hypothetical protein HYZ78_00330 [Candidatus Microgenomates bacterium]|nr:hypothetical protein [Candidatus Microgenomates bacterium]
MPSLSELRQRHPEFIYQAYDIEKQQGDIALKFQFKVEPDIIFQPTVKIPQKEGVDEQTLGNFAFHLGLVETISYWKATCSPRLRIEAGSLTDEQIRWWHDLFINGLGEFFFQNDIDFTGRDFLHIETSSQQREQPDLASSSTASGDLILVGGGKDSAVTLEVLKELPDRKGTLVLNPISSALRSIEQAGYEKPIIVERAIDPTLLRLNEAGYLNGHTPFSAYLAFLGVFVGVLHDYENIIVSNERSAGEGNLQFHDLEVNHQYSKGYRFEKLFREYAQKYLTRSAQYFSFLRPLYDLQISQLFSQYSQHYETFRSCNVGQKTDTWCGTCSKCAFVYLSLFPFTPYETMIKTFGSDYFRKPELEQTFKDLVGVGKHKPFDCVGTIDESRLAIAFSAQQYRSKGGEIPPLIHALETQLGIEEGNVLTQLKMKVENKWDDQNFLPTDYANLLKNAVDRIQKK